MAMTLAATFDAATSRALLTATDVVATGSYCTLDRSTDGGASWTRVRGAGALAVASNTTTATDHEFLPNVPNLYRCQAYTTAGAATGNPGTATITPDQARVWLKSVGRPYMNRAVTLHDPGEQERRSRSTAYDIVGRRTPIAVNDLHSSRVRTIALLAVDQDEADAIDLLTSLGDILYVQVPAGGPFRSVYAIVGDTKVTPTSTRGTRRRLELPLTEVAAPVSEVAPAGGTWQTVLSTYPSWNDVLATHSTWQSLAQLIGSPTDVVVG